MDLSVSASDKSSFVSDENSGSVVFLRKYTSGVDDMLSGLTWYFDPCAHIRQRLELSFDGLRLRIPTGTSYGLGEGIGYGIDGSFQSQSTHGFLDRRLSFVVCKQIYEVRILLGFLRSSNSTTSGAHDLM